MHIDPKVIGIILTLIGILQVIKKLVEKTIGQWILKKIFHWDEIPSWFNALLVNAIAILTLVVPMLQDGVLTWEEIMQIIEILLGANGLFMIYKSAKDSVIETIKNGN